MATPVGWQENGDLLKEEGEDDEEDDGEPARKKPQLSFDVGLGEEDEDDSGLPEPPTPSGLLEDEDDDEDLEPPTLTFAGKELATAAAAAAAAEDGRPASERIDRRRSRMSVAMSVNDGDAETDGDITAEVGRRAISEGPPTERFMRYSFGSIRMSDFGSELEVKRNSDLGRRRSSPRRSLEIKNVGKEERQDDDNDDDDGETRDLQRLRHSPSFLSAQDDFSQVAGPGDYEETYRLELPAPDKEDGDEESAESDDDDSGIADMVAHHAATPANQAVSPPLPPARRKSTALEKAAGVAQTRAHSRRRRPLKLTRHGNKIPSLPTAFVKRIAVETQTRMGKKKPVLSREHVAALDQATEWFFEQVGEDLEVYATHGKRKKRVDESDVLLLMRRQRVLRERGSLKALAKDFLPPDLVKELDLPDQL